MYIIKKDDLYLMGYRDTGIKETDSQGNYRSFLTGVYSPNRQDALTVENKAIADLLGGVAIRIPDRR